MQVISYELPEFRQYPALPDSHGYNHKAACTPFAGGNFSVWFTEFGVDSAIATSLFDPDTFEYFWRGAGSVYHETNLPQYRNNSSHVPITLVTYGPEPVPSSELISFRADDFKLFKAWNYAALYNASPETRMKLSDAIRKESKQ